MPDFQPDHGELISGNNNISILYPISSSEVRLLLNIPGELPKNIKEHLIEMFHPHLPGKNIWLGKQHYERNHLLEMMYGFCL